MWSTVGRVWPSQIRLLTGRPVETSREPRGNLCGSHLSGSRRSGEREPVALRIEHSGASDGPAKNRIANGLPFWGGKQLAIDTTVVSALTGQGVARGRWEGQAIHEAENAKRRRYHELVDGDRCHLLVMAFEVAGRCHEAVSSSNHCLVQIPVSAEDSPPFHPVVVLSTMDSHAGVHHTAGLRSELAGFASGRLQLRERACCVFGRFEPGSVSPRAGSSVCSRVGIACD